MKTIRATGPQLISVRSAAMPEVPKGTVHVTCVRYETYEIPEDEFEKMTFNIHDANQREARIIAATVNS